MIEIINEIEALGLNWSVRRRDYTPNTYLALVASRAEDTSQVAVSADGSSPAIALANAFAKAKRELGIPPGPPVAISAPTPGSFRAGRETVHPRGSQMGTNEPLSEAHDLDRND